MRSGAIWLLNIIIGAICLCITLSLLIYIATFEKQQKKYMKSECEANGIISKEQAMSDYGIGN